MKNLLHRTLHLATENGWKIEWSGSLHDDVGKFVCSRDNQGDGYPYVVAGEVESGTLHNGILINDYGTGPETFNVGTRYQWDVLKNVGHPLPYKIFYEAFLRGQPEERSEKVMGEKVGVSERKIRQMRMCGFVDDAYLLDRLCFKLLDRHPQEVYGFERWLAGVDISEDVA